MFGCRVGVGAEVAYALELHGLPYGYVAQRRLQVARDLDHGFGVEVVLPGLSFLHVVGVLLREERVEQADFGLPSCCPSPSPSRTAHTSGTSPTASWHLSS